MKKIIIPLVAIIFVGVGYWLISPLWRVKYVNEEAPLNSNSQTSVAQATSTLSGIFVNGAHDVSGKAYILNDNSRKILRFEDFKTLNGPDLFIYLASDNNAKDYINLGAIKGTEGNINYIIPQGTDLNKYSNVLVWCRAFSVLFGSAELK